MVHICDYSSLIFAGNTAILLILSLITDYWEYRTFDQDKVFQRAKQSRSVEFIKPRDTESYIQLRAATTENMVRRDFSASRQLLYHPPLFVRTVYTVLVRNGSSRVSVNISDGSSLSGDVSDNVTCDVQHEITLFLQHGNLFRDCDELEVFTFCSLHVSSGRFIDENSERRGILRRLSVMSERWDFRENNRGHWWFSDDIELSFDIEGRGVRHYLASKVKYANKNPRVMTTSVDAGLQRKDKRRQDIGYYTSSEGSFACKPSIVNGQRHCDLVALIHDGKESCFIKGDNAYCEERVDKKIHHFDNITDDPETGKRWGDGAVHAITKPYPGNRTSRPAASPRQKRQISPVSSGTRVIQTAFFLDAAFMGKFYRQNPGNDVAAEDDAEMYTTLLANEMTYRFQTLKERRLRYRGGILELAVNPSAIIYPEKDADLEFIDKNGEYMLESSRDNFVTYVNTNPPEAPFDHAMLLTGLDMYQEFNILGQVPTLETVCSLEIGGLSVSLNEDRDYDALLTLVHELGHALGARHDTAVFGSCTAGRWIMSASAFFPDDSTKDSFNRFSRCSAVQIRDHLSRWPDCLSRPSDETFQENFCSGPRGLRESSFDNQCQTYFDYGPEYTECDGIDAVEPEGCWRTNTIFCYPGTGDMCYPLPYVADGSPCKGPRQDRNYYCYLGECVEEEELCPDGPEPPPPCTCDDSTTRIGRFFCCLFASCC